MLDIYEPEIQFNIANTSNIEVPSFVIDCAWHFYSLVHTLPELLHSDLQGDGDYITGLSKPPQKRQRNDPFPL